ncbi:BPI fold-containing family B member 4-like [Hyaena hyaena]|uniref:BPI fold-containing family B member 4-like n=1 Tax=Hyaena hyaena TaxID=95912 RepID=UPI0019233D46|nr:BPI fold-containing family B member 4-like [Hyaena hyaena]
MLLFWGSLLCWGLLPQTQGEARHQIFLRISKDQLETDISDLFSEHHILDRMAGIPVTGAAGEGVTILDHLPFVREGLSKKSSGLDLSLVGDLLSGRRLPLLGKLLQVGGLVIEDAIGPEVTLQILSDSLLQVTLRTKLYLSLQQILRLKVIKNIRIGIRLEQTGNKTKVAFEECHTPPGYLSIRVLEQMDPLLANEALAWVTSVLDKALPFVLQKIVCPLATTLLNSLLEDLLHLALPPTISGPEDFQYYVITTEFTEEAILMEVQLVTPCGPGQRPQRPDHLTLQPLPKLAQGNMADLAFGLEVYNDIVSCLYTSKEIRVDPQDSKAADLIQLLSLRELEPGAQTSKKSRGNVRLTISTPDPPIVRIDGHTATVTQPGSLVLLGSSNTSSVSVSWNLLSKAVFSLRNQELKLQFSLSSTTVMLGPYPAGLTKQEKRTEALLLELLNTVFLPQHNELLREDLPLPNIKGISFDQAQVELSKGYMLVTVPEE